MFTGIIEEVGHVAAKRNGSASVTLTIKAHTVLSDVHLGDSIATNGVCLTVTSFTANSFSADVMHETLNRSSLGDLKIGDPVNLERAMQLNGRFGGHIVSGHIDGEGRITRITKDDNAIWYTIAAPSHIMRYIVEKGSITIDGISLTVAQVFPEEFSVSVIPHTQSHTNLISKRVGSVVNLENDIIGKYVERLMLFPAESNGTDGAMSAASKEQVAQTSTGLTREFLEKCGF